MKHNRNLAQFFGNLSLAFPGFSVVQVWVTLVLASFAQAADLAPSTGITKALLDVTLSASVPGIITARNSREGDFVHEGAVILELDRKLEELEVERRKLVRDQKWSDFDGTQKLFK